MFLHLSICNSKGENLKKYKKNNSYQCKVIYLLGFLYRDLLGDSHFFFRRGFVYGRCNLSCADLTIEVKHMQLVLPSGVNNNIRGFWVILLFLWSLWFLLSPNSFILLEKVKIKRSFVKHKVEDEGGFERNLGLPLSKLMWCNSIKNIHFLTIQTMANMQTSISVIDELHISNIER